MVVPPLPIASGPVLGIALGLTAGLAWGYGDLRAKGLVEQQGSLSSTLYVHALGLVPAAALLVLWPPVGAVGLPLLGALLAVGMVGALANLWFYRAFEAGSLALVSPVSSSYAAITVVLALAWFHETPGVLQSVGIVLIVAGTVLAASRIGLSGRAGAADQREVPTTGSRRAGKRRRGWAPGVGWALLAAAAFGTTFFLLKFLVDAAGPVLPVLFVRLGGLIVIPCAAVATARPLSLPPRTLWGIVALVVVMDSIAFLGYAAGISLQLVSVVAPLTGTYGGFAALFGYFLLRERLAAVQWSGVALLLLGVVLIAVQP